MNVKKNWKVLFIDIETSPNVVFSWRVGNKISLTPANLIKERAIICISYKWNYENKVHTVQWDKNQCDKKLLKEISKIILEADEIVAHNGDSFDIKWINGRLAYHDLPPLGPLTSSDTLKLSRQVFRLNSQKLDYLGQFFKLGKKVETGGFGLWKDICLSKCPKAMKKMIRYCEQDVKLLEKVFKKIIKYNPKLHRGHAVTQDKESCRNCGGTDTIKWGFYTTVSGLRYRRYHCRECGTTFRSPMKEKK